MKILLLSYIFIFSFNAFCEIDNRLYSVFIEPYTGYINGNYKQKSTEETVNFNFAGYGYGLRTGVKYKYYFLTFDGSQSQYSFKHTSANNISDDNATNNLVGMTAGLKVQMLPIRLLLGYNFIDDVKKAKSNLTLHGTSFKFGLGISLYLMFSLNLEYIKHTYTEYTVDGAKIKYPFTFYGNKFEKPSINAYFLTLSAPIKIFGF